MAYEDIKNHLPDYVTNSIWLPLVAAFIAISVFSFFYMRRYRKKYETDLISFLVSVFALILVFILTALAPVDTFIVSEMKTSDGVFKDWSANLTDRKAIEQNVQIGYIVLYSFICFTVFCILPFTYFLYDSRDDDNESRGSSVCSALISTLIVMIIPALIVAISLFIDIRNTNQSSNSTLSFADQLDSLVSDGANKIISNLVLVLGGLGMLNLIIYTGFGLSTLPIGLIRGLKDVRQEFEEVSRRQISNTAAINSLRSKRSYLGRLNEEDDALLRRLESREREDQLREAIMRNHLGSWSYKFKFLIRPIQVIFGVIFLLISALLIASLTINNIDGLLHGNSKDGYLLKNKTIFNPIDWLLMESNRIYPMDYIIYLAISWYLIFCTLSGVRNLGIGLFFYKIGKFKPQNTTPQGLVLASSVLMMSMLAISILMFSIAPIYTSFGNQVYKSKDGNLLQCDLTSNENDCTRTSGSSLIVTYFFNIRIIGIGFFFSTWFVALFFVLALIYSVVRKPRKGTFNEFDSMEFEEDQTLNGSTSYRSTQNQSRPF